MNTESLLKQMLSQVKPTKKVKRTWVEMRESCARLGLPKREWTKRVAEEAEAINPHPTRADYEEAALRVTQWMETR